MNFPVTLFHNPQCSTSRAVLAQIEAAGITPTVVLYLDTPLTRDELAALAERGNLQMRDLLREKEPLALELGLRDARGDETRLLNAIAAHPVLFNRPVVETPKGVKVCRPADIVQLLLA